MNNETLNFLCNCINFSTSFLSKLQKMTVENFVSDVLEITDQQTKYRVMSEIYNYSKNDIVLYFTSQDDSFKKRVIKKILGL